MSTIVSEPSHEIGVERNVPVLMRDGTILRADVYQPQAEGRYPVFQDTMRPSHVVLPVMP